MERGGREKESRRGRERRVRKRGEIEIGGGREEREREGRKEGGEKRRGERVVEMEEREGGGEREVKVFFFLPFDNIYINTVSQSILLF